MVKFKELHQETRLGGERLYTEWEQHPQRLDLVWTDDEGRLRDADGYLYPAVEHKSEPRKERPAQHQDVVVTIMATASVPEDENIVDHQPKDWLRRLQMVYRTPANFVKDVVLPNNLARDTALIGSSAEKPQDGLPLHPSRICSHTGSGAALRIGTGGLGMSDLLSQMAQAYIKECVEVRKEAPFLIELYHTTAISTSELLDGQVIDLGLTDNTVADITRVTMGVIDRLELGWLNYWLLIGPNGNPAQLPEAGTTSIFALLTKLHDTLQEPDTFLSSVSGSAAHVKESTLWARAGKLPWVYRPAWYGYSVAKSTKEALAKAAEKGAYIISDWGAWYAVSDDVRSKMSIFSIGSEDPNDPLRHSTHLIIGSAAPNKQRANQFVDWVIHPDGGQQVIRDYEKSDVKVYSPLPPENDEEEIAASKVIATTPTSSQQATPDTTGIAAERDTAPEKDVAAGKDAAAGKEPPQTATAPTSAPYQRPPGSVRTGFNLPWSGGEFYFFQDDKYVRVNGVLDTLPYLKALPINEQWSDLQDIVIDAVLPTGPKASAIWFFSGAECILIDSESGKRVPAATHGSWATQFPALATAGFRHIDCVVPHFWPGGNANLATVFAGPYVLTIDISTGAKAEFANEHKLIDTLDGVKFHRVDTFVFVPGSGTKEGYFFSNGEYVRVQLQSMSRMFNVADTQRWWRSLKTVGFFGHVEHDAAADSFTFVENAPAPTGHLVSLS